MRRALMLARRGLGKTSPNPMVGAVIVKNGRIIGEGYHHFLGGDHAEVDALKRVTEDTRGATMYVTLEPCFHHGKTPPCVDAVIRAGISRVVIGMADPDRRVSGRGISRLREKGIQTDVGILEEECRELNESYIKHRSTGLPFVTVKFAQTLDGRIATTAGDSKWISSAESRKLAHRLRSRQEAVLVGAGTVMADNSELTVRLVRGRNPLRIVLDSGLRTSVDAAIFRGQDEARTIVVTTNQPNPEKAGILRGKGIELLTVPSDSEGKVDLSALLPILGERDISSVLVEGGAETITSFIREGAVDRLVVFIAPKILGKGREAVGELDIKEIAKAIPLKFERTYRSGVDIVVEARVEKQTESGDR